MKMVDQLYGEALDESYAFQNPGSVNHLSEALELEGGDLSLMRGLHGYESRRLNYLFVIVERQMK